MNQYLKNLPTTALFLLFLAIPLSKGLASIAFALWAIVTLLCKKGWKSALYRYWWQLGLSFVFLWLLVSITYSTDWLTGFKVCYKHIALLAIPILAIQCRYEITRYHKEMLTVFVVAILINCGLTFLFNFISPSLALQIDAFLPGLLPYPPPVELNSYKFGAYSPLMARVQLSNLISIGALVTAFLWLKRYFRWFFLPAFLLLLLYSISFGGRAGQLGLMAGMAVFGLLTLIFYRNNSGTTPVWVIIGRWMVPLFVLLISVLFYNGYEPLQKRYQQLFWEIELYQSGEYRKHDYINFTSVRRIVAWQNHWEIIKENPVLGVGIGDYHHELDIVYENDDYNLPVNSHNQYLSFWLFGGIIALTLFFLALCFWLYGLWSSGPYVFIFGLSFLTIYGVVFLFDTPLLFQVDVFIFGLFFGVIAFCRELLDD